MVISASRRTDIPAYHADWFMNRIWAGFCEIASPFDRRKVARISLAPADVDAVVFWTRDPTPLLGHLDELDRRDFRYYFQHTLLDYPPALDPGGPDPAAAAASFRRLADRVGAGKVVWRYDPILWSPALGAAFHLENFEHIAAALEGSTRRVVISLYDEYAFTRTRLSRLESSGFSPSSPDPKALGATMRALVAIAASRGMEITSCAEKTDLRPFGVLPGRCIDPDLIRSLFDLRVPSGKDPGQRKLCGCAPSRDIGAYDTCGRLCPYCYATRDPAAAKRRAAGQDPAAPRLGG